VAALINSGPANAEHITGACAAELNALEAAINNAVFLGPTADLNRSSLLTKLDAADAKVDLEKYADAVDKLLDISNKATALADLDGVTGNKIKLEPADAVVINNAVGDAITCVAVVGGLTL